MPHHPSALGSDNARTSKWTRDVFNVHYAQQAKTPKRGWGEITFSEREDAYAARPHSDPLIIEARIEGYDVTRILVDTGAVVNVLFHHAYSQFNHKANRLEFCSEFVISFSGESTLPLGVVEMPLLLGEGDRNSAIMADWIVCDIPSAYNAILGRETLWGLQCFIAGHMLMLKIPTEGGTATIRGDQRVGRECHMADIRQGTMARSMEVLAVKDNDQASDSGRPPGLLQSPMKSLSPAIAWRPSHYSPITRTDKCTSAPSYHRSLETQFIDFLREYSTTFAWSYN